jgi:hypothetical protein
MDNRTARATRDNAGHAATAVDVNFSRSAKRAGRWITLAAVLGVVVVAAAAARLALPASSLDSAPTPDLSSIASLPSARVSLDQRNETLVIELPPTDLPAAAPGSEFMTNVPVHQVVVPLDVSIHSARVEVVDGDGRVLPRVLLHHMNITDPSHRDLFLPSSLHILAASKETPELNVPGLLLGLPLRRGERLITYGMLSNSAPTPYRGVRVRAVFEYKPLGRVFPLFRAYPWVMDAMFPLGQRPGGSKAFDLPPGRSAHSWESSPAIPGYVLGVGGHVHDYAVSLELADVTARRVIWRAAPIRDSLGHVLRMPVARFYNWHSLGVRIIPSHRYRITVTYDNPTGRLIRRGGMGAVAGLFVPDRGAQWPVVDTTNAVYRQDLEDVFFGEMSHDMEE